MTAPKASENLHAYNSWRKALVPLPDGTIIRWIGPVFHGTVQSDDIKTGQYFFLEHTHKPVYQLDDLPASLAYKAIRCTASGKLFKRDWRPYVESVARWIEEGHIVVITP